MEGVGPSQKKDSSPVISVTTKFGRTFLLREPNDDPKKAADWIADIDRWRKWLADGGSDSPPLQVSPRDSEDVKPVARGISGAITRTRLGLKKGAQSMGTLVTSTVAKGKGDGEDDVEGIKKCGWLIKKGQKRWFALKDGHLMWFKEAQSSANSVSHQNAAGSLPLEEGCVVRRVQDKAALVVVSPTGKPYELVAFDNGARDVWMHFLTEACGGQRSRAPTLKPSQRPSNVLSGWIKKKDSITSPYKKVYALQEDLDLNFYPSDAMTDAPVDKLQLRSITEVVSTFEDGVSPTFEARTEDSCHYFMAITDDELDYWTMGMGKYCRKSSKPSPMKPKKPERLDVEMDMEGEEEVQVSDTFILKSSMESKGNHIPVLPAISDDDDDEEARREAARQEIIKQLELESSEEVVPQKMERKSGNFLCLFVFCVFLIHVFTKDMWMMRILTR